MSLNLYRCKIDDTMWSRVQEASTSYCPKCHTAHEPYTVMEGESNADRVPDRSGDVIYL